MSTVTLNFTWQGKSTFGRISLILGITCLALSVLGFVTDADQFYFSYLVAFVFWATLALGGLFFTLLQHVTGAVWSIVVRRASEALSSTIPLLFVFFLPLLLGLKTLYPWTHQDVVVASRALQAKAPYLNMTFFIIRNIAYFAIWSFLSFFVNRYSRLQDGGNAELYSRKMKRFSAGGMFLYAFSVSFAAFDWLMSLQPHWYSTIYGVHIFAGSYLSALAFMTLVYLCLRDANILKDVISIDHFHDFGRLLFSFVVFWTYIGGAQFFLIWYANIPEETIFYIARGQGSWWPVSLLLMGFHFVVPFIILAFYSMKRNLVVLRIMAAILFVMHYVDMYWQIMPAHFPKGTHCSWLDLVTFLGIGGVVIALFFSRFTRQNLVPVNDPKLADSISHNV